MLKKTKVFLASCVLLAGAINVQDAHSGPINYTGNVQTDLGVAAGAGNFAAHPSHAGTWYADGTGNANAVQYLTDMGAGNGGSSINVTLSQDQLGWNTSTGSMYTADVSFTVLGANSLAEAAAGTWAQAVYTGNAYINEPLGSPDLMTNWAFLGGNAFSVIGVRSLGNMTLTASAVSSWGGTLNRDGTLTASTLVSDTKIEFDAISVPAPAAALVMLPGLGFLGMIAAGRRKNFDVA